MSTVFRISNQGMKICFIAPKMEFSNHYGQKKLSRPKKGL